MKSWSPGVALPETALVIGMAMLLFLGVAELVMLAFFQAQTEGAAFVAAHSIAINEAADDDKDKTYAMTVLASPFPQISPGNVTVSHPSTIPGTVQVVVSKDLTGMVFPGVSTGANAVNVTGIDVEPAGAPSAQPSPPSAIAVQATLANYCAPTATGFTCNSAHPLYVAQYDSLNATGSGHNGQFEEYYCRYGLFPNAPGSGVSYPSTMPTDGGPNSQWDPSSANFNQKALYGFDGSSAQWGSASSC